MRWTHVASVASESEPGRSYRIKRRQDGRLGCDCTAYRFARGEKTCKHLVAFMAGEALDRRPVRQAVRAETVRVKSGAETFSVTRAFALGGLTA